MGDGDLLLDGTIMEAGDMRQACREVSALIGGQGGNGRRGQGLREQGGGSEQAVI